ncbi:integrase_H2C2 domain-containing protein [Trichonephila clavipes]|nr:integrase_H2C2 domain-containing protein [Trichonephila clavipes]
MAALTETSPANEKCDTFDKDRTDGDQTRPPHKSRPRTNSFPHLFGPSKKHYGNALSRRPCPESCKYCSRIEKKFGVIDPITRQITTPSTSAMDLWSDESVRKDQLADPEIKPIIEFKESSDENPSWQYIAPFHPTKKRYWALWVSLHLKNGVLSKKRV